MRFPAAFRLLLVLLLLNCSPVARGEALLELFNVNWDELITKMPEIAEAGYTSLWLPPPAKASSVFSVGYDQFDPFDLGDKNQRGTIRTRYGTKAQLLKVVETAHRFGLRVYFDNIVNHRGFEVPGYNTSSPTNLYPGLSPGDFHLRTQPDGTFRNWDNISDWNNSWQIQHRPLSGLIDLANENSSLNENFGPVEGSSAPKPHFLRQPGMNSFYMDANLPAIAGPWHPFNGINGDPVAEDVNAYLIRAVIWTLAETKCDGFRLDAVKHVPADFFGETSATASGYVGAIQTMFDYVHGYGNNALGNGYVEPDDNRNSCFDTEAPRNDAVVFGEHLGEPPSFQEYLDRGMRLINAPYHSQLNNILGNPGASLSGLDQRDYKPYSSAFSGRLSLLFAQSHDDANATHRELQNAYNFFREGLPCIYADGYNQSSAPDYFPRIASAPFLGEFGDNKMPDLAYLHHQLSRGGTRPRWSDTDIVAFERYDYREPGSAADQTVVLFAMNDNYASDISFDDGTPQQTDGTYYDCFPVANSRGVGLAVGFPPGSVLVQLADSPGQSRACPKLLVRQATSNAGEAASSINDPNPANRKIYVGGQTIPPGGGAIELKIPSGGYVAYGYQWPEPSRANLQTNAITLRQAGMAAPRIRVLRHDGRNGDSGFNPLYPFKMRGGVDQFGNILTGINVSNRTYEIDLPVVTNAPLDILIRSDASTANTLLKLDGGLDLNFQMGLGYSNSPTDIERRDNRPGVATDVFLGYEQTALQFRYGPERFAAVTTNRNNLVTFAAETFAYSVGGNSQIVNGSGYRSELTNSTAAFAIHDPAAAVTGSEGPATQRVPLDPTNGGPVEIWIRSGFQFWVNRCFIYYTTNGSNPEGAFGIGQGTTRVVEAFWQFHDSNSDLIDWWKGTIPANENPAGVQVRYKVSVFKDNTAPIIDSDDAKLFGLNQAAITNFDPTKATVWLHNDLNTNNTITGLQEGFHILRARCFLPRTNKSSVFNTFLQTFYYDPAPPTGLIAYPISDGGNLSNATYQVVIRTDNTVTGLEFNIADSDVSNDDGITGANNGNGLTNGVARFLSVASTTPDSGLDAQYPNLPQEFRFNYVQVPSSGSATITIRLREATTSLFPDHVTTLTRTVNTFAPGSILRINNPLADGAILTLNTTDTFLMQTCFSTGLTNNVNLYSIYVNGVLQARSNYIFLASGCGSGLRSLYYYWQPALAGTNVLQVAYSNFFTLSDTRIIAVARPGDTDGDGVADYNEIISGTNPEDANSVLRITDLDNGNRLVVWASVPGINYQVWGTTNLALPMNPISPVIQASGSSTTYYDSTPESGDKFYRVKVVP